MQERGTGVKFMSKIQKCQRDHAIIGKLVRFLNTGIVYAVTLKIEMLISARKKRKDSSNDYCMNCFTGRAWFAYYTEILISF